MEYLTNKQKAFLVNLHKCTGCKSCELACQNEHQIKKHKRRTVKVLGSKESYKTHLSMSCNHCANPACMAVCPTASYKKRRDGIVIHDPTFCSTCKSCLGACPFAAPKISAGKIDKCNMCLERQKAGLQPACVSACAVQALQIIELDEQKAHYHKQATDVIMLKHTEPSVRFIEAKTPKKYLTLQNRGESDD